MEETLEILRLTIGMPHNYQPNKAKDERDRAVAAKDAEKVRRVARRVWRGRAQ